MSRHGLNCQIMILKVIKVIKADFEVIFTFIEPFVIMDVIDIG